MSGKLLFAEVRRRACHAVSFLVTADRMGQNI